MIVCFEVLSGRTAGRSITMDIKTLDGEAKGTITTCMYFTLSFHFIRQVAWYTTVLNLRKYLMKLHSQGISIPHYTDYEDYTYTSRSYALDDNYQSKCVSVPILSDSIDEDEECFTVSLSARYSLSGLTVNPRIGTVCINDDDREF